MKVVMVSKALVVGAYQRKLEELARLPDIELTAIVPPSWREGSTVNQLDRAHTEGYQLIEAPLAFNGRFHLHFYPTLGQLLRKLRPDILHFDEEPYNLATWLGLRLGQSLGARTLFFTWQNLDRHYPWPFSALEQANYRRADHALAGNPTAVRVLRTKGYSGPISVIPQFGVDPITFSPGQPSRPTEGATLLTLGYAGRLVPEKGLDILLLACAKADLPAWRLLLRGEGPERGRLENLATELGIRGRVEFLGKMPSTVMADFYRELDIFVLPSLTRPNWAEQFARVLIEAMACEVPILGSSSGEIPYVLGEGGLLFPEGNAGALAQLLTELGSDVSRQRSLAELGRARVLAHFTQAKVAAETASVYRRMVAPAG